MRRLIKENSWFYLYLSVFLLTAGYYLLTHGKGDFSLWLNQFHSPAADVFFKYITWLGDGSLFAIVCAATLFIKFRYAISLSVVAFFSGLIINIVKNIYNHPRPVEYFKTEQINLVPGEEMHHWLGFPSGHTAGAFAMFCILGFLVANKWWSVLFFMLAFFVAISRVYLFQHFLVDVYAGAIFGVVNATVIYYLLSNASFMKNKQWMERSLLNLKGN